MCAFKPCASVSKVGRPSADLAPKTFLNDAAECAHSRRRSSQTSVPGHRSPLKNAKVAVSHSGSSSRLRASSAPKASGSREAGPPAQQLAGRRRASNTHASVIAQALKPALLQVDPQPPRKECMSTSYFSPASTSEPTSPTSGPRAAASDCPAAKDELAAMRLRFEARESELLQEVAELRGALATARIAQAAAEASVMELRGGQSKQLREMESDGNSMSRETDAAIDRHSEELLQVKRQISLLQQDITERALENERRLVEQRSLLEAQLASQQDQFRNECERIWRAMARANVASGPADGEGPASSPGASPSRLPDPSTNAVLRQIYTAVSELP